MSCNYIFNDEISLSGDNITNEKQNIKDINELTDGIKDLKKENNYFKILKRMFSIYKLQNDTHKIKMLNKIFNSDMGMTYKKISNLEAIKLVKEHYKDADTKKKIEINLLDIKEPQSESAMNNNLIKYKTELNNKAKIIYSNLI